VYHLDLTLADNLLDLSGRQEVLYTNTEDVALDEIYFRLYPNLFSGSIAIDNLSVDGVAIEPEYELRNSAMRVPLPNALQPGARIVIGMDITVEIPDDPSGNYGLFGYSENVLALAHFYPMIPVYDDEGWNVEVPPPQGDVVYADSSFYLVRFSAPIDQVIVSSGMVIDRQTSDDRQTLTIAAGPMRDFYIASSADYVVVSQTVGQTTINSYAQNALADGGKRVLQYAVDAIASYNNRFGTYPFSEFDLANTPNLALGIEYPGVVVITGRIYPSDAVLGSTPAPIYLESTVAHEVAHQWFYSVIGNDQLDEPWLDEAMAQYATALYYIDTYGAGAERGFEGSWFVRWSQVERAEIPIGMPVRDYVNAQYGAIVYGRGPIFVHELADSIGAEAFGDFLKAYYTTYRWGIATSAGYKQLAEQYCNCDLTDLFDKWVTGE
jgi:hypothetical protein